MTTKTLRANLFKQMKALQDGDISVKEARVTAKLSASIIHTIQAEIDNKKAEIRLMKSMARPKKNIDGASMKLTALEL